MLQQIKNALLQIGLKKIFKGFLTILIIILVGYLAKSLDFEGWAKWINFGDEEQSLWYQGKSGYFVLGMLFTAIGGPRQVMAFFAAYFFGLWSGFLVATAAVTASCALAALFARIFRDRVSGIIRGKVDVAVGFWRSNPFTTTLILRLLPVGSNFLTNLAAGATGIPLLAFITASSIGYVPQMAIFSLMGTGVDVGAEWQVALAVVLFAALTLFGVWIYARYRKKIRSKRKKQVADYPV